MKEREIENLSYNEIVKAVEVRDREPDGAPFRITFIRNITLDPMMPFLKYLCYQEGLRAEIGAGNFDNALQDAAALSEKNHDLIVICLHLRVASRKLYSNFASLGAAGVEQETAALLGYVESVLAEARKRSSVPVLIHNFEVPAFPEFGILDCQDEAEQLNVIRGINRELLRIAKGHAGVYVVDTDLLQSRTGAGRFTDDRFWHIARAPYSRDGYLAIAKEYLKFIRALRGRNKKCLVLDCDNTLWGGIIGEDGLQGIKIGQTYTGSCFREFQEAVLNLYKRGVLLALCSRNNRADVEEVLEKHPDMVLRKEHFVAMKIDWSDKAVNLREIARELDIGLDSMVFVDDSQFEADLVKQMVPEIEVLLLPKEPSAFRRALEERAFFDTLVFSEEDRKRSDMYRAEIRRKEARERFAPSSIEDYLKHLEMKVCMGKADPFYVPRIAQLTQRTNQFNLTAKRYSDSEIAALIKSGKCDVFYMTLEDRFGESGVSGAAIVIYDGKTAVIDTFLLSCRVIGRGIEDVMLKVCLDEANQRGCETARGIYVPTKKNAQVAGFYEKHHFVKTGEEGGGTAYTVPLAKAHVAFPPYFRLIRVGDIEHLNEGG